MLDFIFFVWKCAINQRIKIETLRCIICEAWLLSELLNLYGFDIMHLFLGLCSLYFQK
jgi:hypothetical protein